VRQSGDPNNTTTGERMAEGGGNGGWSRVEVEATVADYLHMLTQELAGQAYNKAEHRRALRRLLDGRSEAAIERKHQNISAILLELGCPWIGGYKPLGNFQQLLFEVAQERVAGDRLFDQAARTAAEQPAAAPLMSDFEGFVVSPPGLERSAGEAPKSYAGREHGMKRDYIDREGRNASLGQAGELLVLEYECVRLRALGKKSLSERVEHISATRGDGAGYDVLSFEPSGKERFIEVKTTAFAKETPFFISRNEVEFSKAFAEQFRLYRLFNFRRDPKMFSLRGAVPNNCILDAVSFMGRFA